jgi:hypothetical protein
MGNHITAILVIVYDDPRTFWSLGISTIESQEKSTYAKRIGAWGRLDSY